MTPPANLGPVAGWILFGGTAVAWALSYVFGWSKTRAEAAKLRVEKQKLQFDLLAESYATKRAQLDAIAGVLGADRSQPTADVIEAFAQALPLGNATNSVADHLRARLRAREALPHLINDVVNLQTQTNTLRRDVARGLPASSPPVSEVHRELDLLSERINHMIQDLATSPRITISAEPPDAADGDLWIPFPGEADEAQTGDRM